MTKKSNKFTKQDIMKQLEKCRRDLLQQTGGGSVLMIHPNERAKELFPEWKEGSKVQVGKDLPVVLHQSIGEWPADISYKFVSANDLTILLTAKAKGESRFLIASLVCPARMIRGLKPELPDPDGWDS